ncbi:MAG: cyclase family protein [Acidimicrobiales bacterium]
MTAIEIHRYEKGARSHQEGLLVVMQTGFDSIFGTPAFSMAMRPLEGAAVQWLVDNRQVGGIGSDTYGPDATSDENFDATYTILLDRVAVPGLANLDSAAIKGDVGCCRRFAWVMALASRSTRILCSSSNGAGGNGGFHRDTRTRTPSSPRARNFVWSD